MNLENSNLLHLTQENELVITYENKINIFSLDNREIVKTFEGIKTENIISCQKGYIFTLDNRKNILEVFLAKDFIKLFNIELNEQIKKIYDISLDGKILVIKTLNSILIWDTKSNKIIKEYDEKDINNISISDDSTYLAYINSDNLIYTFDLSTNIEIEHKSEFYFEFNWAKDIRIFKYTDTYKLVISGPFSNGSKRANLLIYDLKKNKLLTHTIVSINTRVPTVNHIMSITDKYIVLCAKFGGMDPSYKVWLADINTGEYLNHIHCGAIKFQIDSLSDFIPIISSAIYRKEYNLEFIDLNKDNSEIIEELKEFKLPKSYKYYKEIN